MMSFDFENYDALFAKEPKKAKEIVPKTVTEISRDIKCFIEDVFGNVYIKGEIFGAKRADSGHWYLSLKDENAVLSAVCWKSTASTLKLKIEDGLEVVAKGKITTFMGKSSYQLVIESLKPAGEGALLKLLEERKLQFLKEGLFSEEHKKPLPFLPETIGVVTSQSGAVIRDIIHRVKDRFPSHILLWPTPVQGIGAAEKIAQAIRGFNNLPKNGKIKRPDVIIVARGGGSLEDLWAFNEECVVRAVYDSDIPIISAVGHETDTMLIDYVADKRAPTPTGAAEFAVPVQSELLYSMDVFDNRLKNSINRYISELKSKIEGLNRGIPNLKEILNENTQKLDYRIERLDIAMKNFLTIKKNLLNINDIKPIYIKTIMDKYKERLLSLYYRLEGVSVDAVLKRGFAWVKGDKNQTIYNLKEANSQTKLTIEFIDGKIKATPETKKEEKQSSLFDF